MRRCILLGMVLITAGPAIASDRYAAIGYSRSTGEIYSAHDAASRAGAEQAVLTRCRWSAADCSAPVWVQNGCVAIAVGQGNGFGSGWGSTQATAQSQAMAVCGNASAGCAIRRVTCTAR